MQVLLQFLQQNAGFAQAAVWGHRAQSSKAAKPNCTIFSCTPVSRARSLLFMLANTCPHPYQHLPEHMPSLLPCPPSPRVWGRLRRNLFLAV